ncbi:MAG: DNA polymerase III subunit delta [Planctomycetaceae bacterium]|nr:DNA polymerase III subunit delta [Planctomycetaceae bacterium]
MAAALHALDFLSQSDPPAVPPLVALFGDDAFLKRLAARALRNAVLGAGDAEFSHTQFMGNSAELREVLDELATVALFGGGRRLVTIEEADEFVSRYRSQLENLAGEPRGQGVLVLEVKTWPSNTRLYKAVAAQGLNIDCSTPNLARLTKWLPAWARQQYQIRLEPAAVERLAEIIGPELGLLDQELAKLSAAAGSEGSISAEAVAELVGGWRAKTTWEMLDAALAGEAPRALRELERLLLSGENAIGVLAQMSSTLRRFAAATRIVRQAEAAGRRPTLRGALEEAGFKSFVLAKAEAQLRQLGRERGDQLFTWLLETDLGLKGQSVQEPRAVLEQLIVRMAKTRAAS